MVQKVDASGTPLWTAGGVSDVQGAGLYFVCEVVTDGAGGAIVSYHHQTGGFSSPRHLKAQRFAGADGSKMWNGGTPIAFFTTSSLQLGNFPAMASDGSGGAVTAWYVTGGTRNAFVQRIHGDGSFAFAAGGAPVAVDVANRIRINVGATFNPLTSETYVVARESDLTPQGNYTVIAQKLDGAGNRLWGDTGVALTGMTADQPNFEQVQLIPVGGIYVTWYNGGFGAQQVFASRLSEYGELMWSPVVTLCTVGSNKARLASNRQIGSNALIAVWADDRNAGTNDIYAQRVHLDAWLGTRGDVDDDGIVGFGDLLDLLTAWGDCPAPPTFCPADLDGFGQVDFGDLLILLANWS